MLKNKKSTFLIIDAGNSKIKYTFYSNNKYKIYKSVSVEELKLKILKSNNFFDFTFYSSVLNKNSTKKLHNFLKKISKNVISIKDLSKDILKSYYNLKQLGEDRIALIMFSILNKNPKSIIIDSGSAITIDFINNNYHLGGYILPGFSLDAKILSNKTQKLPKIKLSNKNLNRIPTNTNTAINNGIIKTKILGIQSLIINELSKLNKSKWDIIITGGDANFFKPYFPKANYIDNLVIKGIILFIDNVY